MLRNNSFVERRDDLLDVVDVIAFHSLDFATRGVQTDKVYRPAEKEEESA